MIQPLTLSFTDINVAINSARSGTNAIIFIHGSCMDARTWTNQLENKELTSRCRLISFDLPGHGLSGRYNAAGYANYRPRNMAALIETIVRHFGVKKFLLVGLSLGSNIIGEIASPVDGCAGILLPSACIVNDAFPFMSILTPGSNGHVMVTGNPPEQDVRAYLSDHAKSKAQAERYVKAYWNTDPAFREELGKTMMEADLTDELNNIEKWNLPVCVVYGREESLINTGYLKNFKPLWQQKIHFIEAAAHVMNEDQPEAFNKLLVDFANDVFR